LILALLCRYDLSYVDALEALAAEGLAVFSGCLSDASAIKQLKELLLTALRTHLGYRGECGRPVHACSAAQHCLFEHHAEAALSLASTHFQQVPGLASIGSDTLKVQEVLWLDVCTYYGCCQFDCCIHQVASPATCSPLWGHPRRLG
jgi:hypothetical protein